MPRKAKAFHTMSDFEPSAESAKSTTSSTFEFKSVGGFTSAGDGAGS